MARQIQSKQASTLQLLLQHGLPTFFVERKLMKVSSLHNERVGGLLCKCFRLML